MFAQDIEDFIQIKAGNKMREERQGALYFSIATSLSLLLVITFFEWKTYDDIDPIDLVYDADNFEEIAEIPLTEQPPPPPPKVQLPQIVEVPDEEKIEEEIEVELDVEITEETVIEEIVFEEVPEEEVADEIFTIVEDKAEPVGGYQAFYTSVAKNLVYPQMARKAGIEGRVFLQFVVGKDGSLSNIVVAKGIGYGCDEAAVAAVKAGPPWKPGKQRGRPVRTRVIVPINFKFL